MQIRSLTNITSFHILENIRKRRKALNLKLAINGFLASIIVNREKLKSFQ